MKHLITQLLRQTVRWLLQGVIGAVLIVLFAFLLVEWASGCGETYVDSKGVRHANECVWTTIKK